MYFSLPYLKAWTASSLFWWARDIPNSLTLIILKLPISKQLLAHKSAELEDMGAVVRKCWKKLSILKLIGKKPMERNTLKLPKEKNESSQNMNVLQGIKYCLCFACAPVMQVFRSSRFCASSLQNVLDWSQCFLQFWPKSVHIFPPLPPSPSP